MLKPERVTFSADDEEFNQFANSDRLNSILNHSLVHYSTDFQKTEQQSTSIRHSHSLDELSSITMTSQQQQNQQQQQQQQQQEITQDPPASAPPSLISTQTSVLNENNLHQFDALTLQQIAVGTNHHISNLNEDDMKASSTHTTSLAEIQKEVDRVKQMKYGRTYSSPTSSLCSRLTTNPFNGSTTTNIDISSITHPVHFNEQSNQINHLPFSSTYITSIPESIVPASISSATNEIHFIPINSVESPSIEDREVFETFHTKPTSMPGIAIRQSVNSLNRDISTSETDLISSLHRSVSKQGADTQSEHGTTYSGASDDLIFVEWDKERSLFQDYINSLRTEIRVLLQERSEYQKQMETVNNNLSEHKRLNLTHMNNDQSKLELLQKSLEEKNFVLEQLQKEYENMKEKNTNLTRKISVLRCDGKSQLGVIDELKEKIAELTVDIQNHILVKRRLEVSMMNLESDCKLIDAERIRLTNDIREAQSSRQDLEKLLQHANVQIAEQGSTIEMLRSDNIQVRSQLSTTQRRMLQEKQQVMDYLRQIESDLVENEQIKQRELILRKDFEKLQLNHQQDRHEIEQLNTKINQDKQKLNELEQDRLQLLRTIENMDDNKIQLESELNSYKSATKRLYTHFKLPFDSIQSIDQLLPMIEDRYRTEQVAQARIHNIPLVQSTSDSNIQHEMEDTQLLREELASMNIRLKQLNEANQAWEQYQQNQIALLQERLKLNDINHLSFNDIVQQIENRFNDLNNQISELHDMKNVTNELLQANNGQFTTSNTHRSQDTQTITSNEHDQTQDDKSHNVSNHSPSPNVTKYEEEIRELQENLATLAARNTQLDEANRAWSQFHQIQLDSFRDKLRKSCRLDDIVTFDDIAQQVLAYVDQLKNKREVLMQQLQTAEKLNEDLRTETTNEMQTIKETYANTINDLTQQVILMKQQNDQLEIEKYTLSQELESLSIRSAQQERNTPTPDSTIADSQHSRQQKYPSPIPEAQIHNVSLNQAAPSPASQHELQQLRDDLDLLTSRCAQLDEANRAWQQYHQAQFQTFANLMHDILPIDETSSLDQAAQQIIGYIGKERDDFNQRYHELQQQNDTLHTESTTNLENMKEAYVNTINTLNEELHSLRDKTQQMHDSAVSEDAQTTIASLTDELEQTKQSQQIQIDNLRNQLASYLSTDSSSSLDDLIQQIVEQLRKQTEDFHHRYAQLERTNEELRSENSRNVETIRESYVNTVDELNRELLAMKEAYDQLDAEKQSMETGSSESMKQPFSQMSTERNGIGNDRESEELRELRESFQLLASQCAQLEEANRAWQSYQQNQIDSFRVKLVDYVPIDENKSLDEMAQVIIDSILKERDEFNKKYTELEEASDIFRSEETVGTQSDERSMSESNTDLNQELATLKSQYDELEKTNKQLASEKEEINNQLDDRSIVLGHHSVAELSTIDEVTENHSLNIPVENEEMCQIRADFDSINSQLVEITQTNQDELESFVSKLQTWIALTPTSTLTEVAHQIHNHFEEQQEKFSQRRDMATQTTVVSENVHIAVETNRLTFANHQTQIDRIEMIDQTSQTESFEQILAESEERNLYNVEDDDERLRDYMDELSTLPSDAFSDRLAKECQQILSKQNLSTLSYADLELNHLALLTVHLLYNQHLTDDAKHLYNETLIRALKQEYELINNEKLDHMEKYHSLEEKCREELNSNKKIYDKLQNKYDELLEQSELERFDSKKSVADLAEQYSLREKQFEFNLFNLHQENDKLKTNLHQLAEIQEKVSVDDYEQLKQDYDELINENELLKEYNSQMYQRKLQDDEPTTAKEVHDVEIQCHLSDEHRPTHTESSSWNNDWEEENTIRHPSTNESNLEKLSKDDEIKRLKTIISQMEHDSSVHSQKHQSSLHQNDSDSSTHDIGIHCSLRSPTIYSSGQAGMEHEVDSTIQTDLAESEENDWNSQMSTFEIASEDDNMTTVTSEHAFKPTMDAETQTDEQVQEKLMQVNTKLKRALQSIKEKIHQAVEEQPELFSEVSEDTIERLDHLIVTIGNQAIQIEEFQNEREELLNKLEETEMKLKHSERNVDINEYENLIRALSSQRDSLLERNKQLEDDIQEIQSNSDMASSEHRTSSDNSTQTAIAPEQQQQQQQLEQQRENVTVKDREPLTFTDRVFGYIPTPQTSHTIDNEAQTDELPYDKVTQVNTKLKRALQTIKDKIYQAVVERPDLFFETNDDTIERLECLISTIGNQATYIDNLQAEYDRAQREIDELRSLLKTNQDELDHERSTQTQPHTSTSDDKNLSIIEDCQKQINQLQQKLASNEDERSLFRERLNEVELELKKSTDNHASTIHMYEEQFESLVKERNAVVEEHALHLSEKLHEIEQLQEQLNKLKQSSNTTQMNDSSQEDIKSLQEVIRQQSDELRDLSDRYFVLSSQVDTQNDLEKQKKEIEEQLTSYKDQVEFLTRERLQLLEEKQKNNTLPIENEKQTGDQQHDKLVKLNSKLKRALQAFKDKICRLVIARPDLFVNIGEETTERFDHLLYTVEHQATRLDLLQAELTESEEHYDERIRQLQNSLERYQNRADSNEPIVSDHLVFEAPTIDHITTTSSSPTRDQHKQMKRLRQKLTANEDEQNQLRQRLTEVEHELKTRSDEHTSAIFKYEEQLKSLIKERNAVIELHAIRAAESQHEIAHLQDELKQSPATVRKDPSSHTNVKSLEDVVQQQSKELRELTDRYMALSAFIESREEFERQRKEADERLADYQSQIENLLQERSILVDEAEKNAILLAQIDDEKRSNDQHHEKLSKVNHKLKRALQTIKDKVHRVAIEKPELFANIGEDTNDRLDHLISFVDHQTSQINSLQLELDQSQEQFRDEIRELQNALEVFQHQIATNHPSDKIEEQMTDTSPSEISTYISSSVFESEQHQQQHQHQQQQINHLREKLSANEDERTLIRNRLTDVEREFRKTLDECASTLSIYEQQIQSLMQERDGLIKQHEVQCEENQLEMVKVQNELVALKQQQIYTDPNTDTSTRKEVLQQQTKRRQDVSEKYMNLLSQLDSNIYLQAELDKLGRETEQQLMNYEKQIENLVREREILLEEKRKNTSSTPVTTDNDKQTGDHQNEKLVKLNNKLKRALQTIKEKIQRIALERPDLFINIGEETNERLDHLIHTVESQATQIGLLQTELHESEEHLQHVVQQLENSFELYRQQAENDRQITPQESVSSPTVIARKTQSEYSERTQEIHSKQTSNEEHWNDWSTESIHCADERVHFHDVEVQCELLLDRPPSVQDVSDASEHRPASVTSRLFGALRNIASSLSEEPSGNDWDDQNSIIQLSTDEHAVQQSAMSPTSTDSLIHHIAHDLHQIVTENPHLFPQSTGDIAEDLNQLIIIIKSFQKEINDLQSSFDTRQLNTENVRSMTAEDMNSNINHNQTLSLSMIEEHQKEIDGLRERLYENGLTYQREIDRLLEEQNVAREQFTTKSSNEIESQTDFNNENSLIETRLSDCQCQIDVLLRERVSLMEQIKQLAHQPLKQHVEIQTENEQQPSTPSDQRISRRVFEQEMLAWSKESEQLKQFVKQIQVENKKLKEIILKFERLTHDYTQENERLKQENQHLSLLSYSSVKTTDENASSDTDICYLTLKWLTYEVAERTFDGSEPSSFIIDSNDPYIKQRLMDTERKLKSIRIQNQKLKKQLETYTIQFKHIQHEMNVKNQEFTILKAETDRLRTSETQYRLEVDRLKADLQCDQVRIQQLEREIVDLKRETNRTDNSSTNNLRELLELKERELNALKEKLDYTTKAHQLELQEAIKANQFSLDNVQRYEQLDQQSQEKRKELETRLGKFCKMIRPLIDNQHLFKQNSIIDIDEIQRLITDTEAEEKVTNSLGAIRDCLGLLENQMKDLHHNLIENHARRSSKWKYKVGFECSSCDSQWEVTHDIQNLQEACQDPDLFLESSLIEPMSRCSCPSTADLTESDIRLCLDDLLDDVIVRTTVK